MKFPRMMQTPPVGGHSGAASDVRLGWKKQRLGSGNGADKDHRTRWSLYAASTFHSYGKRLGG